MAANIGVSWTHRDHTQTVRFVTGHSRDGELSDDLDCRDLADAATLSVV
jgi:uroporphyrin-III C-methyltransferase / precorrin-2 dehydrogenase / sirohydrochlorin ferrochelatase